MIQNIHQCMPKYIPVQYDTEPQDTRVWRSTSKHITSCSLANRAPPGGVTSQVEDGFKVLCQDELAVQQIAIDSVAFLSAVI